MKSTSRSLIHLVCFLLGVGLSGVALSGCMRIDPTHPYDIDSPPELRAPASLVSALFTPEAPEDLDYRVFLVKLTASEYSGVYTRRPTEAGVFRFDGIPPGLYTLSVSGEIEGVLFGIIAEEILLPVGELTTRDFYRIDQLE